MATKPQPTTSTTTQASPLLDLPAELRNIVYHLVLSSEKGEGTEITLSTIKSQTTLLRVCSQIRVEATPIFYGTNTFLISDVIAQEAETDRFLKNAGDNRKLIPRIAVRMETPELQKRLITTAMLVASKISENTYAALMEADNHLIDIAQTSMRLCVKKLMFAGSRRRRTEVLNCSYDPTTIPRTAEQVIGFRTLALQTMIKCMILEALAADMKQFMQASETTEAKEDGEKDGNEASGKEEAAGKVAGDEQVSEERVEADEG